MSTRRPFTLIAAAIFALMMLLQAFRIPTHFQIVLGTHAIPVSMSWVAIVVSALLAVMLYRESQS